MPTPLPPPPSSSPPPPSDPKLAANVLHFARLLRRAGLPVGPVRGNRRAACPHPDRSRQQDPGANRTAHRHGASSRAPGGLRPGLRAVLARSHGRAPGRGDGAARCAKRQEAGTPQRRQPPRRRGDGAAPPAAQALRRAAGAGRGAHRLRPGAAAADGLRGDERRRYRRRQARDPPADPAARPAPHPPAAPRPARPGDRPAADDSRQSAPGRRDPVDRAQPPPNPAATVGRALRHIRIDGALCAESCCISCTR